MVALTCPSHEELSSYIVGKLPGERSEEIDGHLQDCQQCQLSLETISAKSDTLLSELQQRSQPGPFLHEPQCRAALSRLADLGSEPRSIDRGEQTSISQPDGPRQQIGPYRLLAKLGQGGMGTVYKALHTKLDRIVALKVLPADRMSEADAVARFEREMRAVGKLDHPNIVRASDADEENGVHYLVMEYVEGIDLSELVRRVGPLPIAEACELIRQAAVGLQHAHEHGLVHRDIKPSNLMLQRVQETGDRGQFSQGAPRSAVPYSLSPALKILDLGLALLSDNVDQAELTSSGQTMGTLDYMAPEQCGDSHTVDIRADIYSLGATLYKLLTGEPIYSGPNYQKPLQKFRALAMETAPPIQTRRADIPPALSAVVQKMVAREPKDRYATPAALAAALAPFCAGADPIRLLNEHADDAPLMGELKSATLPSLSQPEVDTERPSRQPPAPVARLRGGWPRSRVALLACGGIALLLAGIVLLWQTPNGTVRIEINDDNLTAQIDAHGAQIKRGDERPIVLTPGSHGLKIKHGDLEFETVNFVLTKGEKVTLKVELLSGKAQVTDERGRPVGTAQPITAPQIAAHAGQTPEPKPPVRSETLTPFDLLRREDIPVEDRVDWQPKEVVGVLGDYRLRHPGGVASISLSADGRWVASSDFSATAVLWERATMKRVAKFKCNRGVAFSPDSQTLACAVGGDAIHLYDLKQRPPKLRLRIPNSVHVLDVAFDVSNQQLYGLSERGLQRWRVDGEQVEELPAIKSENTLASLSLDREGKTAVLLENWVYHPKRTSQALVWDLSGGEPRLRFSVAAVAPGTEIRATAISPDGTRLATGERFGKVYLWDTAGQEPRQLAAFTSYGGDVGNLRFTSDGRALISMCGPQITVWDVSASPPTEKAKRSDLPISGVALDLSPDGKTLAVGGHTASLTLLGLDDPALPELFPVRGHHNTVASLDVSQDGKTVVSSGRGEKVRVWGFDGRAFVQQAEAPTYHHTPAFITPAGDYVIARNTIYRKNGDKLQGVANFAGSPLGLSADGKTLATLGDSEVGIVDVAGAQSQERLRLAFKRVGGQNPFANLSADGSTLAAYCSPDKHITWWNLREESPQARQLPCDLPVPTYLAWTPDGQTLVVAGTNGVIVWDWNAGEPRERARNSLSQSSPCLSIAPDGNTFCTGSTTGGLILFDVATAVIQRQWKFDSGINSVRFTPEGRHLLLGYANGVIEVFRLAESGIAETSSTLPPRNEGFVPLFNQQDLSGWVAKRSATIDWKNENGTITGRNRAGHPNSAGQLNSQKQFKDFHFRCEVLAGSGVDPIILFRTDDSLIKGKRRGYALIDPLPNSPLIAQGWGYGALYADDFQVPPHQSRLAPSSHKDLGIKTGDWYRLEFIARGKTVEVRINGQTTTTFTSSHSDLNKAGSIALRCGAGARIAFRRLEIEDLSQPEPVSQSSAPTHADDYGTLATGKWAPVLRDFHPQVAHRNARLENGEIRIQDGHAYYPSIMADDLIVRARVQRIQGQTVMLTLRDVLGVYYSAFYQFDGSETFGIGMRGPRFRYGVKQQFAGTAGVMEGEFFELAFSAVGDTLTVYANGTQVGQIHDSSITRAGGVAVHTTKGQGVFKDVEVMVLDKAAPAKE